MEAQRAVDGPPLSPALACYVGFLLRRAHVRARYCAATVIPEPHRPRHVAVLAMLHECGPLSQRELGLRANVNRTIMVKVVDELEAHGLVVRERNPADRRSYALAPTKHGLAILRALTQALALGEAQLTAALTEAEHARLNELLRRLLRADSAESAITLSLGTLTGYLIAQAHYQLRRRSEHRLAPLHLALRQFGALAAIAAEAPCSQQRIATILGVSPPAVLAIIDELAEAGLVRRTRNPVDRRAYQLTLTDAGRDRLQAAHHALAGEQAGIVRRLGADSEAELRALLTKML
jgi:DNA-binding MarR family transcriptional regulator